VASAVSLLLGSLHRSEVRRVGVAGLLLRPISLRQQRAQVSRRGHRLELTALVAGVSPLLLGGGSGALGLDHRLVQGVEALVVEAIPVGCVQGLLGLCHLLLCLFQALLEPAPHLVFEHLAAGDPGLEQLELLALAGLAAVAGDGDARVDGSAGHALEQL
jgi:hypothetical protein